MDKGLRVHELLGLLYQFLGATAIGIGIYFAVWFGVRPMVYRSTEFAVSGNEWLLFPLLFGLGAVLWTLGSIEVKEAIPGHKRK